MAEEAKRLAEEIQIEKLNEQWAGIPHEQFLNQSFRDQLNSIQILEQLVPLQLAKQHLPVDIIDILECLGKADNNPFNQLYYIAENCVDRYYMKVIETFVSIIKRQFANHNTYEASQHIRQEYRFHLHDLDDGQYYTEIDRAYYLQDSLAAQDYWLANQSAEP